MYGLFVFQEMVGDMAYPDSSALHCIVGSLQGAGHVTTPEIALTQAAALTPEQQAFRQAAKHRLDLSLPLDVWFDHRYSVTPSQREKPVPRRGAERWYDYAQVVKRGVDPRSKRRVVVLAGGAMSGAARPRK